MSDWTTALLAGDQSFGVLSSVGPGSPAGDALINIGATPAGATWPSANLALYIPVMVMQPVTVAGLGWVNGTVVSGNVDVGVYDYDGNRLVHSGSTAQSGTSAAQLAALSSTALTPDLYYLAMAVDNVTATIVRLFASASQLFEACGVAQQATAFPLPATATFAVMAQSYLPVLAGQIASVL